MKQKIGIGVGVVLAASLVGFAQSGGSASDEVLRAVRTAGDAQIKGDKATLERFTADDFLYVHSSGTVANKADELAAATAGDMKWTSISYSDLKARIYDNAAIVTGVETLVGTAKGYDLVASTRSNLIFVRAGLMPALRPSQVTRSIKRKRPDPQKREWLIYA